MKYIHPSEWLGKALALLGKTGVRWHYAINYRTQRHDKLNVKNPRNLSEYIIGKVLNDDFNQIVAQYADKYEVREYVRSKGLGDTLLDCYGVWNRPEDIDWERLPERFALKANNGCGSHVFCRDKTKLDKKAAVSRLKDALSLKEVKFAFEPHYKLIPPKIYAEELMQFESQADIIDYKFMCVGGGIDSVLMVYDRTPNDRYKLELRDENWVPIDGLTPNYNKSPELPRPKHFDQMKTIARVLSEDFEFVRVDLYEYQDKIYFGELTFTPQGGQMSYFTIEYLTRVFEHIRRQSS